MRIARWTADGGTPMAYAACLIDMAPRTLRGVRASWFMAVWSLAVVRRDRGIAERWHQVGPWRIEKNMSTWEYWVFAERIRWSAWVQAWERFPTRIHASP